MKLGDQMMCLKIPKQYCKICFNEISDYSLYSLCHKNNIICENCFSKFEPKFINFKLDGCKGLSIYEYDQNIKELLFKFKGCFDIELKDVFLDRYINYLKVKYHGFVVVPIPSYHLDDLTRGFNHVEQIYNRLNLSVLKLIKKTKQEKQANKNKKERLEVAKIFEIMDLEKIKNKKVLIVDDVMTTGSSMSAAINLVKGGKPKRIELLAIAKNVDKSKKR